MKKLSLFLAILMLTVFCACDEKNAPVTEEVSSQTTVSQTTKEAKTTTTPNITTIPETTETADNEPDFSTLDGIQKYLNQLANDSYDEYALADLDQNGYPEVINIFWDSAGSRTRHLDIELFNGNVYNGCVWCDDENIKLYRDKNNNCFYIMDEVWSDGGYSTSKAKKVVLDPNNNNFFVEQDIAYYSGYYEWLSDSVDYYYITENYVDGKLIEPYGFLKYDDFGNDVISYENELNKYLSQYDFVTTVNVASIWSIEDEYNVRIKKIDEAVKKFRGANLTDGVRFTNLDEKEKEYVIINGEKTDKLTTAISIYSLSNNFDLSVLNNFPNLRSVSLYSKDEVTVDISPILNNSQIIELCLDGDIHVNTGGITESKNLKMINFFGLDNINFVSKLESVDYAYIEPDYNNTDKDYFKPLYSLPNLKWFKINGIVTSVTTEQREEMKKNMPDCIFSRHKIG
ncbi:MAG TPA: hypothetical protein PKI60_00695 [Oscillospiraceae bacterium]|nr:hypothetical protein [Oscillospiraceae bacterium]